MNLIKTNVSSMWMTMRTPRGAEPGRHQNVVLSHLEIKARLLNVLALTIQ